MEEYSQLVPTISPDLIDQIAKVIPEVSSSDSNVYINIHFDQYIQNVFIQSESLKIEILYAIIFIIVGVMITNIYKFSKSKIYKFFKITKKKRINDQFTQEDIVNLFSQNIKKEQQDKSSSTHSSPCSMHKETSPMQRCLSFEEPFDLMSSFRLDSSPIEKNNSQILSDQLFETSNLIKLNEQSITHSAHKTTQQSQFLTEKSNQIQLNISLEHSIQLSQNQTISLNKPPQIITQFGNHFQSEFFENGRFERIFNDIESIGQGTFGQVFKAKHRIENHVFSLIQVYAIKKIYFPINKQCPIDKHKFYKEVLNLRSINHKNVLRIFSSWIEEPDQEFQESFNELRTQKQSQSILTDRIGSQSPTLRFEEDSISIIKHQDTILQILPMFNEVNQIPLILFIQIQYCTGKTLKDYIYERQEIDDSQNFFIISNLLSGLDYIHQINIVHRDLKPANIFFNEDNIVIGDFGISTNQTIHQINGEVVNSLNQSMTTQVGTPMYSAPEQLESCKYDYKVDIYSLGLILFELCYQNSTCHEKNLNFQKIKDLFEFPDSFGQFPFQMELIKMMLNKSPQNRPSVQQIYESEAYISWKNNIKKL